METTTENQLNFRKKKTNKKSTLKFCRIKYYLRELKGFAMEINNYKY